MINCHFIDILTTFSPEEVNNFRYFITSPYFNKRKKIVELFDIIKEYYPFFNNDDFTREKIFAKFYPKEPYNYGKINEALSYLYKLSTLYLKQVAFEKNTIFPESIFREELRKRSLKNIFNLFTVKTKSRFSLQKEVDSNMFLSEYNNQIETINYLIMFSKNNKPEKVKELVDEVNNAIVTLTNFYVSEITSLSASNYNYSLAFSGKNFNIFNSILKAGIISKLFEIVKPLNKYDFYVQLLNCYFEAINDINDSDKYYSYKSKFFEYQKHMSSDDLEYHFACLVSYCLIKKRIPDFKDTFTKEYLNLYEEMLRKKLFLNSKSDFLLKEQYVNMLINYEAVKDNEKIKWLMEYIKFTHPDVREDLRSLSKAYYYFLSHSYNKTLEITKKINFKNKVIDEKVIGLEIKSLYEMGKYVECEEKIMLFKKQIRNNSLIDKSRIQSILVFLKSTSKLISLRQKSETHDASYLKNQLDKTESIPSKEWLIEKCYELYEKPKQVYQY
ncbi:MAG: hypothetical protein J0M18_06695 [Ignavibacteria bacterium]|nr:hypothetical protein [Ignavibacteria bacterium]